VAVLLVENGMTTVLILEGDMPELVALGDAWSTGFVRTFLTIAPQLDLRIASLHVGLIDRSVQLVNWIRHVEGG